MNIIVFLLQTIVFFVLFTFYGWLWYRLKCRINAWRFERMIAENKRRTMRRHLES